MAGFDSSLETLFNKMESFVSSKTVVGQPIELGGTLIVPLVDVAVGVGAGSGGGKSDSAAAGGGGGLGAKITPSAVIVVQNGSVQMINVKSQDSVNKLIDMVPGVVSKLNFGPFKTNDTKSSKVSEVNFEEKIIMPEDAKTFAEETAAEEAPEGEKL